MSTRHPSVAVAFNVGEVDRGAAGLAARSVVLRIGRRGRVAAGRPPGGGRSGRLPSPPGKAKSVIQIWAAGGPTHLDTFDPKPDAG